MSITIIENPNIKDLSLRRNFWQEKHNDRRPTERDISMEVSPSNGTVKIGPPRKYLSISAEYNNNRDFPDLSEATLSYKYARWKVLGGAYSSDSSENYKDFLGGTVDSKLGTFTGEIHSGGDQYSLGYSTEGTWIGVLLAHLNFTLTESGEAFTYSGTFKIGPAANLLNKISLSFEVSDNKKVYSVCWNADYKSFILSSSIGFFEDSENSGIQSTISLSKQFKVSPRVKP